MLAWFRWRIAHWKWLWAMPLKSAPRLGGGWLRQQNLEIMTRRWQDREPKLEDFK